MLSLASCFSISKRASLLFDAFKMILQPALAKAKAIPWPMPREEPVIKTVLPFRLKMITTFLIVMFFIIVSEIFKNYKAESSWIFLGNAVY